MVRSGCPQRREISHKLPGHRPTDLSRPDNRLIWVGPTSESLILAPYTLCVPQTTDFCNISFLPFALYSVRPPLPSLMHFFFSMLFFLYFSAPSPPVLTPPEVYSYILQPFPLGWALATWLANRSLTLGVSRVIHRILVNGISR